MTAMPYILSLDEGTTSARAVLYDQAGRVVAMESNPIACQYPHPGWVEQDALEIWRAQTDAARRLLDNTGIAAHVTDLSNASRTMLMNLQTGEWDDDLLRIFDVPRAMLPSIRPSSGVAGVTGLFGGEIPIAGVAGDQQAALAGQACFRAGLSKNTYGTGCFALTHSGGKRPYSGSDLLATRAASLNAVPQFAVEGSVFVAGAAVQWLRDSLGLIGSA